MPAAVAFVGGMFSFGGTVATLGTGAVAGAWAGAGFASTVVGSLAVKLLPRLSGAERKIKTILPAEIGRLQRFRSGRYGLAQPGVTATVSLASGMTVSIPGRDYLAPGTYDLGGGAGSGLTYVDNGATLPAGVSVQAGKLVLVV